MSGPKAFIGRDTDPVEAARIAKQMLAEDRARYERLKKRYGKQAVVIISELANLMNMAKLITIECAGDVDHPLVQTIVDAIAGIGKSAAPLTNISEKEFQDAVVELATCRAHKKSDPMSMN